MLAVTVAATAHFIREALRCGRAGCPCMRPGVNGVTHCPAHEDTKPSLSVTHRDGRLLVRCHGGCPQDAVLSALRERDLWPSGIQTRSAGREIVATYDYRSEAGDLLFQVVRYHPKDFRPRQRGADGAWIYNLDGVRRVPYRLHELHAAILRGERIVVAEGEKDCDGVCGLGLVATTVPGGSNGWRDEYAAYFTGARDVVILPHHDPDGEHFAARVAGTLTGLEAVVRIVRLPNLSPKGDAYDWINGGGTRDELERLIAACAPEPAHDARPEPAWPADAVTVTSFHLTDLGNAERLVAHHGPDLRYDHPAASWFVWDGRRWLRDASGEAHRRAKATVRMIYGEAQFANDDKARQAIATWAMRSEADARIDAMLSLSRSERAFAVTSSVWDADPWALNCLNGTLDLRTGELRPHKREDLLTKLAPVAYDPAERCDLWDWTLEWALPDPAVRAFFQRAVGYALTADPREDKLFFVHGPTAALKSTINEAIKAALGDYAMTADFETFLKRRDVGGPRNDIARLAGVRLVLSIEVEQGRRLAEGLIKMLTGGDTISARFLFHEAFEFRPTFTIFLVANHAPRVPDDDDALWRRIVRIPFEHVLPKEARDPTVKAALRDPQTAGAAILAWAAEGCLSWQRDGLQVPPIIETATDAYRADMDPLADFFAGCRFDPQASVLAADLRTAYETWARENGERPLTGKDFAARLRARGCTADRTKRTRLWRGIGLATAAGDTVTPGDGSFDNLHTIPFHEGTLSNLASPAVTRHPSPDGEPYPPLIQKAIEVFDAAVLPE